MSAVELLRDELCQLTPHELAAFCDDFPARLPKGRETSDEIAQIAQTVLEHESPGDALSRALRYSDGAAV